MLREDVCKIFFIQHLTEMLLFVPGTQRKAGQGPGGDNEPTGRPNTGRLHSQCAAEDETLSGPLSAGSGRNEPANREAQHWTVGRRARRRPPVPGFAARSHQLRHRIQSLLGDFNATNLGDQSLRSQEMFQRQAVRFRLCG